MKFLQQDCGNNFSFLKGGRCVVASLKVEIVAPDETLVSFNVSALFTGIPVPVALKVIYRK